jgi:hypothetical protein
MNVKQIQVGPIIRDVVIVWVLTAMGGAVVGFATGGPTRNAQGFMLGVKAANVLFGTVGFAIAGCLAPPPRWHHLGVVAVAVWFAGLINVALFGFSVSDWIASAIVMALIMGLGGAISFAITRALGPRSSLEGRFYDVVAVELRDRAMKPGLLAQALVEASGDEAKARAIYIRLRVAQLTEEERQRQKEIEAAAIIAERQRGEAAARDADAATIAVEGASKVLCEAYQSEYKTAWIGVGLLLLLVIGFAASRMVGSDSSESYVRATKQESSDTSEASETTSSPVSLVFHNGKTPRYAPQIEIYHLASAAVGDSTCITGVIRNGTARRFSLVVVELVVFDKGGTQTGRQTVQFADFAPGESRPFESNLGVFLSDIACHRFDLIKVE